MEGKALVAIEPLANLGVFVSRVVVEDHMDALAGRNLALDLIEEANELLVAMALHVAPDHRAVEDVEGGEQRGRAVALVVVRHGAEPALLQRQPRLGSVERLDLALLVERQDDRMGWRVDVEADNITQLLDELRIVRELELPHSVRSQAVGAPDALDRAGANPDLARHHRRGPVGRLDRWIG